MFSQKSIRTKFLTQLVSASATLIVIFSVILYQTIKTSIYANLTQTLTNYATTVERSIEPNKIINGYTITHSFLPHEIEAKIELHPKRHRTLNLIQYSSENKTWLNAYVPLWFQNDAFLVLYQDITSTSAMLDRILRDIVLINLSAVFLILFYALFLSRMLLVPIKTLAGRLSRMNEGFLKSVETKSLPEEFIPLGLSINRLIERIQTFVKYQKELFIGTAHELKTPLAVMKTKNEVTLLKSREKEKYIEAIKNNIEAVDEMNSMISAILEIGRQEGAQFEEPILIDVALFLEKKINDFKILAHLEEKNIVSEIGFNSLKIKTQQTLLTHILQNFVQNALKFSDKGATVTVKAFIHDTFLNIEVYDEGVGIDESKDLFAPFVRFGSKGGSGLGLFLAKGAADALGASISISNKKNGNGAVAKLALPI